MSSDHSDQTDLKRKKGRIKSIERKTWETKCHLMPLNDVSKQLQMTLHVNFTHNKKKKKVY